MKYASLCIFSFSLLLLAVNVSPAKSPVPINEVATIEQLEGEVLYKIEEIEEYLEGEYNDRTKSGIKQAAGVLACIAQAIAEHPDNAKTKIQGPAVRDRAFKLVKAKTKADVKVALLAVTVAIAGKDKDKHELEHPWNKLVSMHSMMEEINGRNSKIRRLVRRTKGTVEEQQHAATTAVLALAMAEDTHEVKDKTKIPDWKKMSFDYQKAMTEVSKAVKEKDKTKIQENFLAGNKACDDCHEVFRDN